MSLKNNNESISPKCEWCGCDSLLEDMYSITVFDDYMHRICEGCYTHLKKEE